MNIYKVSRTDKISYDEYDSFIVVASNLEDARKIHPNGDWENCNWDWVSKEKLDSLEVILVGTAFEGYKEGDIILTSFNAG